MFVAVFKMISFTIINWFKVARLLAVLETDVKAHELLRAIVSARG